MEQNNLTSLHTGRAKNTIEKPKPLPVLLENIPQELKELNQWVCWRYEYEPNRAKPWTKPPFNARTGHYGKSNDSTTWSSFDIVWNAYQDGKYDGIGFAFHLEDGFAGVDLDDCIKNGKLIKTAHKIVDRFRHTYIEVSPSGEGLRILGKGCPQRRGKGSSEKWVELYDYDSPRYLTITGQHFEGSASTIDSSQEELDWLHETYFKKLSTPQHHKVSSNYSLSVNLFPSDEEILQRGKDDPTFQSLMRGDLSGYNSHSEADGALLLKLAFYTEKDHAAMDRIFRSSGMYREEKWNRRRSGSTHGAIEIENAIRMQKDTYSPHHKSGSATRAKDTPPSDQNDFRVVSWKTMRKQIEPIQWCWEGWLPTGLLTILASDPGVGKSALALRIATTFIKNLPWPDGSPYQDKTGSILWCEAESAEAINMERAQNWDIPMEHLLDPLGCDPPISVQLDKKPHQDAVKAASLRKDVRFIVVDSLRGIHRGEENSSAVIEVVMWLAQLARDIGKPILLTHHLRKRSQRDGDVVSLDRLRGSSAIVQPARVVWALDDPNPTQKNKRLAVIKSNIARFPDPLGFTVGEEGISFDNAPSLPRNETILDRAKELLATLLQQHPRSVDECKEKFEEAGISRRSMYNARDALGVISSRQGKQVLWSLRGADNRYET